MFIMCSVVSYVLLEGGRMGMGRSTREELETLYCFQGIQWGLLTFLINNQKHIIFLVRNTPLELVFRGLFGKCGPERPQFSKEEGETREKEKGKASNYGFSRH